MRNNREVTYERIPGKRRVDQILIQGADILFWHFGGDRYGKASFSVLINDERFAHELATENWNIRILRPRDEGDEARQYIPVEVSFRIREPLIFTIAPNGVKTQYSEDMMGALDQMRFKWVNVRLNGSTCEDGHIKAYLDRIDCYLEEDAMDRFYAEEEYPGEVPFN